jgi:hypothetical protein
VEVGRADERSPYMRMCGVFFLQVCNRVCGVLLTFLMALFLLLLASCATRALSRRVCTGPPAVFFFHSPAGRGRGARGDGR